MKKTYTPSTDIHQKQGQELSKKLYRTISEQSKRLDDARSCARTIGDLFAPNLQVLRRKFCEYCERLIFSDPIFYGKKGEELLWRKGYYEVVATAKKLKKKEYLPEDTSNLQAHINAGIGFYHHLISKVQCEFNLGFKNCIDFTVLYEGNKDSSEFNPEALNWARQSIHQCLIYLGDLNRYKLDIYPNWEATVAIRYYLQAVSYRPDYGMPHNQMGTLAMNQNLFLDAVYHYMRCLACKFPFEGTTNNLHGLFDKNSKFIEQLPDESRENCIIEHGRSENVKRFLARFLLLIDIWYFDKKVAKVYSLCHQTYKNLEECLVYTKPPSSESGETPTDIESIETEPTPPYLSSDMIFKISIICLLCISKLRTSNSPQVSTLVAFTLAIYSQLIQNITTHIEESVLNYPLTETMGKNVKGRGILKDLMNGKKRSKSQLRRRKALKIESDEESEASGSEDAYSSSDDSFISDSEDVLAESSEEESDIIKVSDESNCGTPKEPLVNGFQNGVTNPSPDVAVPDETKTKEDIIKKVQLMDVNDMLEIISEEGALHSIKILNDWLRHDPEVLKSCGINTRTLIRQITHLLNLININLSNPKIIGMNFKLSEIIHKQGRLPLSEDVILKGVELLAEAQKDLDWNYIQSRGMTVKEEAVVRIVKLISFGKYLTTVEETGVSFDEEKNVFVCKENDKGGAEKSSVSIMEELELQEVENGTFLNKLPYADGDESKGQGQLNKMKHMGQLWLAAEVRALESRVGGKAALSPYLVLDSDALIKYTFMVKHLVHSRKFIVLVPTAVVSALDDLKREKIEARDAIRWLESQFQRGNRFFRAQRPQERAPIPFIKYPKKKDKEMHVYIQIIECCHFLAEQQKGAPNVVTLLIGNHNVLSNGENKEFSYVGLAKSAGVAIESVTSFYGKWKKSKGSKR